MSIFRMLKKSVLCFAIATVSAITVQAKTHQIIAIHGIGSQHSQFGALKEALETQINQMQLGQDHKVIYFDYSVSDDVTSVYDIARSFETFMTQFSGSTTDEISIVTFSEGCLVLNQWLLNSFKEPTGITKQVLGKIRSVTTIAAPYWGSDIAQFGSFLNDLFGIFLMWDGFGARQVSDMSIGSAAVFARKEAMMDPEIQKQFKSFAKNVRWVQLVGGYHAGRYLFPFETSEAYTDHDLAVPAASASLDFEYYDGPSDQPIVFTKNDFTSANIQTYRVEGLHIPSVSSLLRQDGHLFFNFNYPSLIGVDKSCVKSPARDCSNPTFQYTVANVAGIPMPPPSVDNSPSLHFLVYFQIDKKSKASKEVESLFPGKTHELTMRTNSLISKKSGSTSQYSKNGIEEYRFGFEGQIVDSKTKNIVFDYGYGRKILQSFTVPVQPGRVYFVNIRP